MPGLFRNDPATPEGKYKVVRRDGTVPEWPYFVLGARDPHAPRTLLKYAAECEAAGLDPQYVADVRRLAGEFEAYRVAHGSGRPDGGHDRVDDPATVASMSECKGA